MPASDPPKDALPPSSTTPPAAKPAVTGDYRQSYRLAIDENRRRWEEAAQLFQCAAQQNGTDTGERINISGFGNIEPYVPKYYLGLSLKNLNRCPEALQAWEQSERDRSHTEDEIFTRRFKTIAANASGSAERWTVAVENARLVERIPWNCSARRKSICKIKGDPPMAQIPQMRGERDAQAKPAPMNSEAPADMRALPIARFSCLSGPCCSERPAAAARSPSSGVSRASVSSAESADGSSDHYRFSSYTPLVARRLNKTTFRAGASRLAALLLPQILPSILGRRALPSGRRAPESAPCSAETGH